jgi:hypothetical protein
MEAMKILILVALAVALAGPAFAQQLDLRATPPPTERPGEFVAPGPYYDITEPRENPWYPHGVRVPYDPAFIEPASTEYETLTTRGRYGVAGWSSQNVPVGPYAGMAYNEQPGWLSFGFAFTWGAPPRPAAKRAPPALRPGAAPSR